MEELRSSLDTVQRAQLHEVADHLLEIYKTIARMRFLKPEWIEPGPHDISDKLPAYRKFNIDDSILYLYSIMPYIKSDQYRSPDFFHGSSFIDYRDIRVVERGRDPFYFKGAENPEHGLMKPWMTPLSELGNHESCIIYCAKTHRIWIVDQECWDTTDPGLKKGWHQDDDDTKSDNEPDEVEIDESETDEEDSDYLGDRNSEYSSEEELEYLREENDLMCDVKDLRSEEKEWEDHLKDNKSEESFHGIYGALETIPSRSAPEVLGDMNQWYLDLKETPGDGQHGGLKWHHEGIKDLYRKYGWPSEEFAGDAFLQDLEDTEVARRNKYRDEQPLREVSIYQQWLGLSSPATIEIIKAHRLPAANIDEEWKVHLDVWSRQSRRQRLERELAEAEEAAIWLCPGGKPQTPKTVAFWKEVLLQRLTVSKETEINRLSATKLGFPSKGDESPFYLSLEGLTKLGRLYSTAHTIARHNAEVIRMGNTQPLPCHHTPGSSMSIVELVPKIQKAIEGVKHQEELEESCKKWAIQVPSEAVQAQKAVENTFQLIQKNLNYFKGELAKLMEEAEAWERNNPVCHL
ncbi:hypothetical protein N7451_012368 [Penicillium sp. IBT 35674x]|nr:hypothetical protein N7451_012368 [Penicillium sp. IBT 35674x]